MEQQLILSGITLPQFLDQLKGCINSAISERLTPPETKADYPEYVSPKDGAVIADVSVQQMHVNATKGLFCRYKFGGKTMFKTSEILAAMQVQTPPDGRRTSPRRVSTKKGR